MNDTEEKMVVTRSGRVYNAHLAPIRVACLTLAGVTLTVPFKDLGSMVEFDPENTYTLSFKTLPMGEYMAMGEFNGF